MAYTKLADRAKKLRKQIEEKKRQKNEMLHEFAEYKKTHGSEFFRPLKYQDLLLQYMWEGRQRLLMQGANQIGKTLIGSALVDSWCRGVQAWNNQPSIFGGKPTKGRIICTDWEYHAKDVIVPKLKAMIPHGSYITTKNNQGVEAFWTFPNGSYFDLMTIKQDTQSHESSTLNWIWGDEPMPEDKYSANCRGLIANMGIFLLTMTAVGKESWILDKIALNTDPNYGCVTRVPMNANTYLTEAAIAQFMKDCPDSEIEARVYGGWLQLTGMVIKNFIKEVHMIEEFEVPAHWPVIPFIDIHLNKPQAISFFTFDPMGREYQIDEIWDNLSPEEIAEVIVRLKREKNWNITEAYIDPLAKGDAAYMRNRREVEDSFTIIKRILKTADIKLYAASKDKDSGIRNIESALKGINKMPALFFFRDKTRMTIHQIQRWIYDDMEKPMKKDDDFGENLYRSTLLSSKSLICDAKIEQEMKQKPDEQNFDVFINGNCAPGLGQSSWMGA